MQACLAVKCQYQANEALEVFKNSIINYTKQCFIKRGAFDHENLFKKYQKESHKDEKLINKHILLILQKKKKKRVHTDVDLVKKTLYWLTKSLN